MKFQNFDIETFLRDHWQKQPLLIRNPWRDWVNPLEPDELAGLACEEAVESRLVTHSNASWSAEHGPFAEERFAGLGKAPWTLLVQAVDHQVPEVAALIEPFRFIPGWRIDDVMVSLAADSGGVGPHFDQYDVFLIQGLGRRRWQIGARCDANTPLIPHDDLRLLAQFQPTQEWLLEPGDILYLPPGISHNGIAVGDDCMTYSVGFRAPSRAELIGHYVDDLLDTLSEDDRFADPGLIPQPNPGEISADAIGALHSMITEKLGDPQAFACWFGKYNSTPKYPDIDWSPDQPVDPDKLRAFVAQGTPLARNPASRFAFIRQGSRVLLFVDGDCTECACETAAFAETLCARDCIEVDPCLVGSDATLALIEKLTNRGSVAFDIEP